MRHTFALFLVVAAVAPSIAQDSAADWIAKLSSRSYVERESAARKLEQFGKTALPLLRQIEMNGDLETQRRAALILERIEQRLLYEEIVTATPMRYRFQDISVDEALRDIEKLTGLRCGEGGKERMSFATSTLPFWQAWRQFCQAAKLEESDFARWASPLKPMRDAALTELTEMLNRRDFDITPTFNLPRLEFARMPGIGSYATDDRHSIRVRVKAIDSALHEKVPHATLAIELRAEPRLDIVAVPKVVLTQFTDEAGRLHDIQTAKMLPEAAAQLPSADFLAAFIGEVQYGGLLHLRMIRTPDASGTPVREGEAPAEPVSPARQEPRPPKLGSLPIPLRKLKELHGNVRLEVMVRPRMIEMPSVPTWIGKEVRGKGGVTLKVLAAEKTDEGDAHLRLLLDHLESLTPKTAAQRIIRVRPGVIAERGAADVALDRLQLLDRTGRVCPRMSWRYLPAKNGKGVEAELSFTANGREPEEFTLVMTEEPRQISVHMPFLVRDVALQGMTAAK